ncbi:MAG: cytochrome P450 [Pseudonocardiaceae bacterium]
MTTAPAERSRRAPGPRGLPLIGSALELRRDLLGLHLRAMRELGDVVRFWAGPPGARIVFYTVYHPDAVQRVLAGESGRYRKDNQFYAEVRWAVGDGLLTSQDQRWLRQRRLTQPLFTKVRVAAAVPSIVAETNRLAQRWHPAAASGGMIDLHAEMTRLTMLVVARAVFGADLEEIFPAVGEAFPPLAEYTLKRGFAPLRTPRSWPTPANRRAADAKRALYRVVDGIIAQRRAAPTGTDDLLARLLDARDPQTGQALDDAEIRDQVLVFLLAGHETTATTLTMALHLLGRHPQAQARVRAEVDTVLGGRTPVADDLAGLGYTTMVVQEATRLYPAAYLIGRRSPDGDRIGDFSIPPRSEVYVCPWATHRHPGFWEHPDRFEPERFTPQRVSAQHRYAWFPFGGGPRACIGQYFSVVESLTAIALLLRAYHVDTPPADIPLATKVTLRPAGPVPCRVTPIRL